MSYFKKRRHSNEDFARANSLILADVLMSCILGMVFLGFANDQVNGIAVTMPHYMEEAIDTIRIPTAEILHVDIDSNSFLMVDSVYTEYEHLSQLLESYLITSIANRPKKYFWLRVDRMAKYENYILLRDAINVARKNVLDQLSIRYYSEPFSEDHPFSWKLRLANELRFCVIEEDQLGAPFFEFDKLSGCM